MGIDLFNGVASQATPFTPESNRRYAVIDPRKMLGRVERHQYYDPSRDEYRMRTQIRDIENDQLQRAWELAFDNVHLQVGTSFVGVDMAKAPEEPERDLKSLIAYYYNR